ncbi:MAG: SDR family oxidoreductase [Renibacterium sp.]|nr:SDR family oxidoreductase [Renibacterium sp.]
MKNILIAGGSSAAGVATAKVFVAAGHRVLTVGSSAERIAAAAGISGAVAMVADLSSADDVARLHAEIAAKYGPVHGLAHLVGGWRGGGSIPEQDDADWDFLANNVIQTLRLTSREFFTELAENSGRLAIVSSTGLAKPTASNANYVAAKAAAEAWTLALADGFAKVVEGRNSATAAAVIFRVKALLTEEMKAAQPERKFPGYTHVDELAASIYDAFTGATAELNSSIISLG